MNSVIIVGSMHENKNCRENLDFHARLSNIDRDVHRKRIDKVLDIVGMREIEAFDDPISRWRNRGRRS